MSRVFKTILIRLAGILLVVSLLPLPASAVKIGDITHLQGSRINRLMGIGFVVGLKGTGDAKFMPSMQALAQLYKQYAIPVITLEELKNVKSVAIVHVEAVLPRDGVREGDSVDVKVSSIGSAKSLVGGRLLLTPMVGPHPDDPRGVMALAAGPIQLDDKDTPTVGRIAEGATLEQDWIHNYVAWGRDLAVYRQTSSISPLNWIRPDEPYITFVIDDPHADWSVAYTIAQSINEETSSIEGVSDDVDMQIARAFDPRTVIVRIPKPEQSNPAPFLAQLEHLHLSLPFTEARVTINHKSGTIAITGDAEIATTVITHKGLTITTVRPESEPTQDNPRIEERDFIAIDPQKKGGAKLRDLIEALNQLRVPVAEKISIIEDVYKLGNLHATLVVEQ